MNENQIKISTVYTFPMPKYVYIQFVNGEKPIKIVADKMEKEGSNPNTKLVLKKGDSQIGEFRIDQVVGWWIQDQ